MQIKARKVGNSISLTIPTDFDAEEGTIYEASLKDDGTIVYKPIRRNIFEGDWFNEDLSGIASEMDDEPYESEWQE